MNEENTGVGFCLLGQVALIVLKLLDVIDWSWWKVMLPLEISIVLCIIGLIIYILVRRSL